MMIIIFNTRSSLYAFSKKLTARSIPHNVINTPKNLGRACSLSIKIAESEYAKIKGEVGRSMGDIYAVKKI